jgi:outer membrane protein OmpA-like peptidoglycan-associated protein
MAQVLGALMLATAAVRANPGDAENAQDYPGFPRQPGFVITDYSEDNPAEADFPVAHALPLDAAHVDSVRVRGHRFVIRYELASGHAPTVYQTQLYYEKLAAAAGYQVAKSGAVGDVTETFCQAMAAHDIWVFLEPGNSINVITVIEAPRGSTPIPPVPSSAPPAVTATPSAPAPAPAPPPATTTTNAETTNTDAGQSRTAPTPTTEETTPEIALPDPDRLYKSLLAQGRVIVPFVFQPGREELDPSSQPLVDRVVTMMERHPDLSLRIEGHTDNSGDPEDNMRLSADRAIAVRMKIMASKVDGKRLDAVGVGGLQPLADNSTTAGRAKNRRIELVVWKRYSHRDAPPASSTGA